MSWLVTLSTWAGFYESPPGRTREGSVAVSGSGSGSLDVTGSDGGSGSGVTDRGDGGAAATAAWLTV